MKCDHGPGACNDQVEGGKRYHLIDPSQLLLPSEWEFLEDLSVNSVSLDGNPSRLMGTTLTPHPGDSNAFSILHSRATLQNLISDKNQAEGVHCSGPCIPKSKWFEDVCEDAITIKNDVSCQVSVAYSVILPPTPMTSLSPNTEPSLPNCPLYFLICISLEQILKMISESYLPTICFEGNLDYRWRRLPCRRQSRAA